MLAGAKPSIGLFESILSVTHAEGNSPTVYSTLCDLKNKKGYLFNFHNYTNRKEIDLPGAFKNREMFDFAIASEGSKYVPLDSTLS